MLLIKNPQFSPNFDYTLPKWSAHWIVILTKYHKNWVKIVDFLLVAYFWAWCQFCLDILYFGLFLRKSLYEIGYSMKFCWDEKNQKLPKVVGLIPSINIYNYKLSLWSICCEISLFINQVPKTHLLCPWSPHHPHENVWIASVQSLY